MAKPVYQKLVDRLGHPRGGNMLARRKKGKRRKTLVVKLKTNKRVAIEFYLYPLFQEEPGKVLALLYGNGFHLQKSTPDYEEVLLLVQEFQEMARQKEVDLQFEVIAIPKVAAMN